MSVNARPHTKFAAALLAAGMVATAPAVVGAGPETLPALSNIEVRTTSFVSDVLYNLGSVASAPIAAVEIATELALGLNYFWDDSDFGWGVPINPVFLASAFIKNPGSALSYLLQTYLNPSDYYADPSNPSTYYYSYPWSVKAGVLDPVVNVLPGPLAAAISGAINNFANGINDAFLKYLPDPTPTVSHMWEQYNTPIGRLIYAAQFAIALPVTLGVTVGYYLVRLPYDLEATIESAIQKPGEIPGLISNLVHSAVDPDLEAGLLGTMTYNLLKPLFFLPAPIGESGFGVKDGIAYAVYQTFANAVNGLLDTLPAPITPTPFPSPSASVPAASKAAASPGARSARTAVTRSSVADRQRSSDKSATAKTGDPTGGRGHSARPNRHDA